MLTNVTKKIFLKLFNLSSLVAILLLFTTNCFCAKPSKEPINLLKFPAYKYYRLTGINTPPLEKAKSYRLRMTKGEYRSIALLMRATNDNSGIYNATVSSFKSSSGYSFSKDNLDLYIAKIWYQAGVENTHKSGKFLTQELLLKDESLIKVDRKTKTNYLRVFDNISNREKYINISDPNSKFPKTDTIVFNDSKEFKRFKLEEKDKLIWAIIHIPKDTPSGVYRTKIKITNSLKKITKEIPVEIEVLPFLLDKSNLIYSLYYHGRLKIDAKPIDSFNKNAKQLELELRDMKEHGVLYPTSYDYRVSLLDEMLEIRDRAGLPKDRFYSLGILPYQHNIPKRIQKYKEILNRHGYSLDNFYIYATDEADKKELIKDIEYIKMAKENGVKVFVAGSSHTHKYIGDILDTVIFLGGSLKESVTQQIKIWHKLGHKIFLYASPQVGVENPEIYRRNFGCKLWKMGFDGAMDYAYQKQYIDFWNDFDNHPKAPHLREEAFTYPTSSGIIGTIQWEGYREAITDVRYISTLENIKEKLKKENYNVNELERWLKGIDCSKDLSKLREGIVDKIIFYKKELRRR